jgi:hypothetical protein
VFESRPFEEYRYNLIHYSNEERRGRGKGVKGIKERKKGNDG